MKVVTILANIDTLYGDTSQERKETLKDLERIREKVQELIDTLDDVELGDEDFE